MRWITDDNYLEQMRGEVEPYLAERRETGFFERVKGEPIYFEHYRAEKAKGVIVISHGFTESIRKFTEPIYYFLQAGYEVWGVDHRGHGRSVRLNDEPAVVYVKHFSDYVKDLVYLTETKVKPAAKGLPLYLYCHSMGGCIGAWTIEAYPELFEKAVLSSPMLGLSFGKLPLPLVSAVAGMKGLGNHGKAAMTPVTPCENETFADSASTSEPRFCYYHEKKLADETLQTGASSTNWLRQAIYAVGRVTSPRETAKVRIPVLLFQAGRDAFVKNASQDLFASRVRNCELVRFPELKHELYMSDLEAMKPYWEKIFAFLG